MFTFLLFEFIKLSKFELEREGGARLDTDQLDTTNHSDRCLEIFHCSSAVSGSCSIDSCPNEGHPERELPQTTDQSKVVNLVSRTSIV